MGERDSVGVDSVCLYIMCVWGVCEGRGMYGCVKIAGSI